MDGSEPGEQERERKRDRKGVEVEISVTQFEENGGDAIKDQCPKLTETRINIQYL